MSQKIKDFRRMLFLIRRNWLDGLLICAFLRLVGWVVTSMAVVYALDYFLAFEQHIMLSIDIGLIAVFSVLFLRLAVKVLRLHDRDATIYIDSLLDDKRRQVLGAYELDRWLKKEGSDSSELHKYLIESAVAKASEEIRTVGFMRYFPVGRIIAQLKILLLQSLAAAFVIMLNTDASLTVLSRIAFPWRDIPPYSKYVFDIKPAVMNVIYGGNLEVSAEITGKPVTSQVWFYTRHGGKVYRTACFQSGDRNFAQKLEKVVSPIEICFGTGRARSRWHKVDLLLQPEIASVDIIITPPGYSRLPKRQFELGHDAIAGLRKSRVEMFVKSNRPLSGGAMEIVPKSGLSGSRSVKGVKVGSEMVGFAWILEEDAVLDVTLADIRGTRNRDKFLVSQKILPDKPPEAAMGKPYGMVMATPEAMIPVEGSVSDDIAIQKVDLVRSLVGYRDRPMQIDAALAGKSLTVNSSLDLKKLGVSPGQTIEIYLQVQDNNPDMTGLSVSEVSKIQIISDADYAALMRARASLEQVMERYYAVRASIDELAKKYGELKDAADKKAGSAELEKAVSEAKSALDKAAQQIAAIARDYPIYDMEKSLNKKLAELMETLGRHSGKLSEAKSPYEGLSEMAESMLNELGQQEKEIEEETKDAEEMADVGRVMEMAAAFKQLYQRQAEITRRLSRYEAGVSESDKQMLSALAERQKEIEKDLADFVVELRKRTNELSWDFEDLKVSADKFANDLESLEITDYMKQAAVNAQNQVGKEAYKMANMALEKMKELMNNSKGSGFGDLGEQKISFQVSEDMSSTLQQMLEAALSQGGSGKGKGIGEAGSGLGGTAADGYQSGGSSPMNLPVYGPSRQMYGQQQQAVQGQGGGSCPSGIKQVVEKDAQKKDASADERARSGAVQQEAVPEKYREVLRKYFTEENQ